MTDKSKITAGIDFNRFFEITVNNAAFHAEVDVQLLIRGPSLHFYIRNTGVSSVEFSFNGNTVHGRLAPNSERLYPFRRVSKIWFRSAGTTVEIEAWATA